jgi:hypothetical protein
VQVRSAKVPTTTYNSGVKPGEGANREDLRGGRVVQRRRKPSTIAGARLTSLDTGMSEAVMSGGGIQTNAHPEFNQPTPGEQLGAMFMKLFGKKKKATPVPAPPGAGMSVAEEDALSKKYLGR